MLRNTRILARRTLFKGSKLTPITTEVDTSHEHEYSIRPDTFAFKVSGNFASKSNKLSPFQESSSKFHIMDFVYRNSTNYPFAEKTPQEVFNSYPAVTSKNQSRQKHRPRKVKMTVGDFIEDSLYNPNYGYFSSEVEIFKSDKPFDYKNIKDVDDFLETWEKAYSKYDLEEPQIKRKELIQPDKANYAAPTSKYATTSLSLYNEEKERLKPTTRNKRSLQLWHTPTELFQPYYGEAIARNIVSKFKETRAPGENLIIYEMGGGNGTLMTNILSFIKDNEPRIYKEMQYNIIEISSQLAMKQYTNAIKAKLASNNIDSSKVEIINKSIFEWKKVVEEPVFFIALEVFDNFAHDLVRYDNDTGAPHQGHVLIDDKEDFFEFFTPELDYYTQSFLELREHGSCSVLQGGLKRNINALQSLVPFVDKSNIHPLHYSSRKIQLLNSLLPLKDNLTPGEFIPTRLLQFFHVLNHRFPNHRLISSDFNYLPNTIGGYYNGPVVQTVLKDKMVDVTTYMCHQGFFDIMFPTDFKLASDLYSQVTGKTTSVESHRQFLQQWADVKATTTQKGENPMLDFYTNVSFMIS